MGSKMRRMLHGRRHWDAKVRDSGSSPNFIWWSKRYVALMCDVTTNCQGRLQGCRSRRAAVSQHSVTLYCIWTKIYSLRLVLSKKIQYCMGRLRIDTCGMMTTISFLLSNTTTSNSNQVWPRYWQAKKKFRSRASNNQPVLVSRHVANVAFDSRNGILELDSFWKQETWKLSTRIGYQIVSRASKDKAYNNQPVLGGISRMA